MIESIKYALISDIYVKELLVYDIDNQDDLSVFCLQNGISYVPGKDRKSVYRFVEGSFQKAELTEDLICSPTDRLFDQNTLAKFEQGSHDEVLFVMEGERIIGVVHIVDYNKEFINIEFYSAIYAFETMLRNYLTSKGETNQTLLDWMEQKAKENNHWKRRYKECVPKDEVKRQLEEEKRNDFGPFQTFFLNDLLHFSASKRYVSKDFRRNLDAIIGIRNWVAHNKDLAHKIKGFGKPLYRIKELKEFVNNANAFFACYEEIESKLG
jgi:hypothetical protein